MTRSSLVRHEAARRVKQPREVRFCVCLGNGTQRLAPKDNRLRYRNFPHRARGSQSLAVARCNEDDGYCCRRVACRRRGVSAGVPDSQIDDQTDIFYCCPSNSHDNEHHATVTRAMPKHERILTADTAVTTKPATDASTANTVRKIDYVNARDATNSCCEPVLSTVGTAGPGIPSCTSRSATAQNSCVGAERTSRQELCIQNRHAISPDICAGADLCTYSTACASHVETQCRSRRIRPTSRTSPLPSPCSSATPPVTAPAAVTSRRAFGAFARCAIMCRMLVSLYCLAIVAASTSRSIAAVNPESLQRIAETLDGFMKDPVQALDVWQHYRLLGAFDRPDPSGNAPDGHLPPSKRSDILRFQFSFALAKQFKMYYGDEDGAFLAYDDFFVDASYREPRNSGYGIDDPEMQQYYNACVNIFTGQPTTCNMEQGAAYIACLNNCDFTPCPSGDDGNAVVKYCKSYEQRRATFEDSQTKGFVPRTYSCIDQNGQFTETPGQAIRTSSFVAVDSATDDDQQPTETVQNTFTYTAPRSFTLGDCTYRDGKTLVQREKQSGSFDYCDDDSGDGNCTGTFTGGYRSRDYDPRVRGWYQQVRSSQQPAWSNPYTFFTTLEMGITYGQPMYVQRQIDDGIDRLETVFQGVLAVDYPLSGISEFLREEYGTANLDRTTSAKLNTPIGAENPLLIAIAEDAAPHYLIGTSTARKTAQTVLKEDPTQPCPPDAGSEQCSAVRVSVLEETDVLGQPISAADDILRRAYEAQIDVGFDESVLVPVLSGTSSSIRHVSKSLVYKQDQATNLKWRIVVVFETVDADADSLEPGNPLTAIVIVLGSIGFLACMAMWIQFYKWRTEKAMIHADWRFTLAFLLGCALMNLCAFTALGPNTDGHCMLRMWSFNALFTIALAPLLVKVWRMYSLIGKSTGFTRKTIPNASAALYTLPIIIAELVLLLLFSVLDPPRATVILKSEGLETIQHVTCEHRDSNDVFLYTQFGFNACLVIAGCVLAYLTRNLDPKFGEAKQLIFAMYNVAFTGIVITIITALIELEQSGEITMKVIGVFWGSLFSASAFVLPRLMQVKETRRQSLANAPHSVGAGRNNVYVSGIDLSIAPVAAASRPNERRSTFGSTRGSSDNINGGGSNNNNSSSGSSWFRPSVNGLLTAPKLQQELSNLEEESELSAMEDVRAAPVAAMTTMTGAIQVSRRIMGQERPTDSTHMRKISSSGYASGSCSGVNSNGVSRSSSNNNSDDTENDDDIVSSPSSDEDYDKGGPQWDAEPAINSELHRSCRWDSNGYEVPSTSFSIDTEGPEVQQLKDRSAPGKHAQSKLRSIEDRLRDAQLQLQLQMESINEENVENQDDCSGDGEDCKRDRAKKGDTAGATNLREDGGGDGVVDVAGDGDGSTTTCDDTATSTPNGSDCV